MAGGGRELPFMRKSLLLLAQTLHFCYLRPRIFTMARLRLRAVAFASSCTPAAAGSTRGRRS